MTILNWIFKPWFLLQLKQQQQSPFKLKLQGDAARTNCITDILSRTEIMWLAMQELVLKLGVKEVVNNSARIVRNDFGMQEAILPNPVFTLYQAAGIRVKYVLHFIAMPLFIAGETGTFYVTMPLFLPGIPAVARLVVSVGMAILFMTAIAYAFEVHFKYREAVELHHKKILNEYQLRIFRDKRTLGYALGITSFIAVIIIGFARVYFLEFIPPNELNHEKLKNLQTATKWGALFTILVTVVMAVLMGVLKHENRKNAIQYRVLHTWRQTNRRRNSFMKELIKQAHSLILTTQKCTQRHWLWLIEIKKIFRMPDECDGMYANLQREYLVLKATPGFVVTESIYLKYLPIQSCHQELFRFGVMHAEEIAEKTAFAIAILRIPKDYIDEYSRLPSVSPPTDTIIETPASSNGKDKSIQFINKNTSK